MWYSSYCVHWKKLNSYPHAVDNCVHWKPLNSCPHAVDNCVHWKPLNSYPHALMRSYPHAMLLSLSLLPHKQLLCGKHYPIRHTSYKSLASRHEAEVGVVLWCIGANSVINNTWKPAVGGALGRPLCFYTPNLKSVIRMRPRALPLHMCTSYAIHL